MSEANAVVEIETPLNTDLSAPIDVQPIPTGVSPLVAMLANGQLTTELVDQALDLQERHDAYEAKKAFSVAMARFRTLAPTMKKDSTVDFSSKAGRTHYKHTSLGYAMSEVNPILGECGLNLSWHPRQENGNITVVTRLTHTLGHSDEIELTASADNSGNKNGIQAIKSTITYLERIGSFSILGLASEDDDDGQGAQQQEAPAPMSDKLMSQIVDLIDTLSETGQKAARDYYIRAYGEDDTPLGIAIPARETGKVVAALKKKIAAEKKASEKAADGDAL